MVFRVSELPFIVGSAPSSRSARIVEGQCGGRVCDVDVCCSEGSCSITFGPSSSGNEPSVHDVLGEDRCRT